MGNITAPKLYVDENAVRIVALQVTIIALLITAFQWPILAVLLAIDFALRAFTGITSPLAWVAKRIVQQFGWVAKPIFAPPKRFAAGVGFAFAIAIFALLALHFTLGAFAVLGILLVCAVLEWAFKICVGCYVYNWLVAPWYKG